MLSYKAKCTCILLLFVLDYIIDNEHVWAMSNAYFIVGDSPQLMTESSFALLRYTLVIIFCLLYMYLKCLNCWFTQVRVQFLLTN